MVLTPSVKNPMVQGSVSQLFRLGILLSIACGVGACGGQDDSDQNVVPNGSRLGWSQPASSAQQVQSMSFKLFVDGVPGALTATSCGSTATSGRYECSGRLPNTSPGRHVLELSAVLNGVEGDRSEQFSITVSTAMQGSSAVVQLQRDQSGQPLVCLNPRDCYDVRVIATRLGESTSLTRTPDGRVFFIESEAIVRVIDGDALMREPALVADPSARFVGLAVDQFFGETRSVFVASASATPSGEHRVDITRYREVAGTFGEGATIVSGLPFREGALAPLAVDRDGLLYVALPSTESADASIQRSSASDATSGKLLRFTRDGQVPETNRAASPVIAQGYASPSGLAVDAARNRLWLAGRDDDAMQSSVSTLSIADGVRTAVPRVQSRLVMPSSPPTLALFSNGSANVGSWLLVAADQQLLRGAVSSDGRLGDLTAVPLEALAPVRAVVGSGDSWYVAAFTPEAATTIVHLQRR
jgi:hypothetical protein